MKTKFRILVVLLAVIGLSNWAVAQTTFYANAGETLRVKCWSETTPGVNESLDTDCQVNLSGTEDGDFADTIIVSGGPFYMEAGNESADYMYYSWIDGPDEYTHLIYDQGGTNEWSVNKYNQNTGYEYIGTFWVRFVYTSTFTVTDQSTGNPISGAIVTVTGHGSQVTNASGICSFSDLPNASYNYSITASGYDAVNSSFTVNKGNVDVNVGMTASIAVEDVHGIELNVYPNPCTSYVTIDGVSDVQWELYSITGKMIKRGDGVRVGMSDLTAGYYVLNVITVEGSVVKRVLKQ